ncbi:hypothetical protein NDU88_000384 [Pleurodeles waltl]|uniref:Uncharacterized protein n=1 Tax=Pleurodeles waltl TaxID=8319 RepID=A0AAV7Q2Y5_PLEWA|nr:hypothetical protein NDU88_000384 [Pleurodeles waltl]
MQGTPVPALALGLMQPWVVGGAVCAWYTGASFSSRIDAARGGSVVQPVQGTPVPALALGLMQPWVVGGAACAWYTGASFSSRIDAARGGSVVQPVQGTPVPALALGLMQPEGGRWCSLCRVHRCQL